MPENLISALSVVVVRANLWSQPFQSADGYDVVEGSRLVVTRVVKKDRSSKYLLDDKTSSFTEVGKVLRKRGIDLDNNRFLILQVGRAVMPTKCNIYICVKVHFHFLRGKLSKSQ